MNPKHKLGGPCRKNPAHVTNGQTLRYRLGRQCVACDKEFRTMFREYLSEQQTHRRARKRLQCDTIDAARQYTAQEGKTCNADHS